MDNPRYSQHVLNQSYDFPEIVKSAKEEAFVPPQPSPAFYADPIGMKYPCHNAPATIKSAATFLLEEKMDSERSKSIMDKLVKSAAYFGATPELESIIQQHLDRVDDRIQKLGDDQFALVVEVGSRKYRQYPIRNVEELKAAASYLLKNRRNFFYNDRQKIATKILAKSLEYKCDLEDMDSIVRTAGMAACDKNATAGLLRRASLLVDGESREKLSKKADVIDLQENISQEYAVKVAEMVESIYKDAGCHPDILPEDVIFRYQDASLKKASDQMVSFGGEVFKKSSLSLIGMDKLAGLIGERAYSLMGMMPLTPQEDDKKSAITIRKAMAAAGLN